MSTRRRRRAMSRWQLALHDRGDGESLTLRTPTSRRLSPTHGSHLQADEANTDGATPTEPNADPRPTSRHGRGGSITGRPTVTDLATAPPTLRVQARPAGFLVDLLSVPSGRAQIPGAVLGHTGVDLPSSSTPEHRCAVEVTERPLTSTSSPSSFRWPSSSPSPRVARLVSRHTSRTATSTVDHHPGAAPAAARLMWPTSPRDGPCRSVLLVGSRPRCALRTGVPGMALFVVPRDLGLVLTGLPTIALKTGIPAP